MSDKLDDIRLFNDNVITIIEIDFLNDIET